MELLKEVGNGIHKSIQIEVDYPSRHEDNLMPILDLKVWIHRKNVIMNGEDCTVNVVLHEFYAKGLIQDDAELTFGITNESKKDGAYAGGT